MLSQKSPGGGRNQLKPALRDLCGKKAKAIGEGENIKSGDRGKREKTNSHFQRCPNAGEEKEAAKIAANTTERKESGRKPSPVPKRKPTQEKPGKKAHSKGGGCWGSAI